MASISQAYLDNAQAQTGKSPDEFRVLAEAAGLTKHGQIVTWLKADYGLGHGHATAVAQVVLKGATPLLAADDALAKQFAGAKATWRPTYDALLSRVREVAPDIAEAPTSSYISWVRDGRKFAVVQVTGKRLDVGIKLKGEPFTETYTEAGAWNAMVTHRRQITAPEQVDDDLIAWLRRAYEQA